jgi:elongation factor G
VDSSRIAFEIAASKAFYDAVRQCNPVLLEPVMSVQVIAPMDYIGRVLGDLNARRAQVHNVESRINGEAVNLDVPLAEMFSYATQLRSLTQGRGTHTMEFSHYNRVPDSITDEMISIRKMYGLVH